MLPQLRKALKLTNRVPTVIQAHFFSKEAPKKDAKKDDKAAPAAPVVEEPSLEALAFKWIFHTHQSLSPSELKYIYIHEGYTARVLKTFHQAKRKCWMNWLKNCWNSPLPSFTTQY